MCDRGKLRPIVADLIRITHELAAEAGRLADRVGPAGSGSRFATASDELQGLLARLIEPAVPCRPRAALQELAG